MLTVLQSSFVPGNRKKCELIPRGRNPYATRETVPHIHQTKQETGRRLHQDKAGLLTPRRGPGSQRGQGVLSQLPGKALRCPAFQAQFSTAGPLIKTLKHKRFCCDTRPITRQTPGARGAAEAISQLVDVFAWEDGGRHRGSGWLPRLS